MAILKLKKINFTTIKLLLFAKSIDIETVLVSNKISFGEKSYTYFIGYLHDNHKVKALHIMLPRTSTYVKSYDGQTDKSVFWLKMMTY